MTGRTFHRKPGYPVADCKAAWQAHRRWRNLSWLLFALWIPFGFLIFSIFELLPMKIWHREAPASLVFSSFGIYAIAWIVICNVAAALKCPNCGYRFFAWGPWGIGHNTFARRCRNCGLRKWACNDLL